jgi:deazaflavin-dependent oxidoreductase (nitroreductase family)
MNDNEFIARNQQVVEAFRASGGKVEGGLPLVLLTIKGAKTGKPYIYPLMSVPYENGYLAVASKGGAPEHPKWYHNLVANPDITLEVGADKFPAHARLLSGEERARAFEKAITVFAPYADYQKKTEREIPVFLLERS